MLQHIYVIDIVQTWYTDDYFIKYQSYTALKFQTVSQIAHSIQLPSQDPGFGISSFIRGASHRKELRDDRSGTSSCLLSQISVIRST
jgi:hypothetical protein